MQFWVYYNRWKLFINFLLFSLCFSILIFHFSYFFVHFSFNSFLYLTLNHFYFFDSLPCYRANLSRTKVLCTFVCSISVQSLSAQRHLSNWTSYNTYTLQVSSIDILHFKYRGAVMYQYSVYCCLPLRVLRNSSLKQSGPEERGGEEKQGCQMCNYFKQ